MDVIGQSDSNPVTVQQSAQPQPVQNVYTTQHQQSAVQAQVSAAESNTQDDSLQPAVQEKKENPLKESTQPTVQNFFDMNQVPEESSDNSQPEDGQFDIF